MSADEPLWHPDAQRIAGSRLQAFIEQVQFRSGKSFESYADLHQWSIDQREHFWANVWDYCGVQASVKSEVVLSNADDFMRAQWFPDAMLNFAENLLRYDDDRCALVGLFENGDRESLSYSELLMQVTELASALRRHGIVPGDRVVGFMPNIIQTVVAMLASSSLGATWSSCSPDFGITGVCDRFGQITPRILFSVDAYQYNGRLVDCLERVKAIQEKITSIEKTIVVPLVSDTPDFSDHTETLLYADFVRSSQKEVLHYEQLPFDHPQYIMYSSGTTGVPKCIVHGAGGTLIQHLKEHQLHTDIDRDDVLFYYTTCGWMMWNWLVSGLASGCTVVLYEGSPFASNGDRLLDVIDAEGITVFGTSARYIASLQKAGKRPMASHDLSSLKTILSTGSPLVQESYDYVYREVKADVCLASISGGTDIISCFVLGHPALPVHRGEIQSKGLGMAVEIWTEEGNSVTGEKGELVCTLPFPSCPIGFWNDLNREKYQSAYFNRFDKVWAQGDYGEITVNDGVIIHGRSDAVLNPGGVRIGTAEIYRQVEKVEGVIDSIVVGQQWQGDVRVVLFVVLRDGWQLDNSLTQAIKSSVRRNTTPRHVPEIILQVMDIPRTISGKIVELAVRQIIHGETVKNTDALANPEALLQFRDLPALKS